ncbi:hypothetical protein ACIRCZ_20320 [Leifsonia sp. NPDC102414]|uniref:hypothetical protein n=1 Tax=Leifsonia sp. NPDC102414 TaxID=3364124 RepID=UPI0037FA1D03
MTAALSLAMAPGASATIYTGNVTNAYDGNESHRWDEEQYSELDFYNCQSLHHQSVQITYYRALDFKPDPSYDQKLFTACFKAGGVSVGEWHDLPWGMYYFQIGAIDSGDSNTIDVESWTIDTTKAD